ITTESPKGKNFAGGTAANCDSHCFPATHMGLHNVTRGPPGLLIVAMRSALVMGPVAPEVAIKYSSGKWGVHAFVSWSVSASSNPAQEVRIPFSASSLGG